MQMLKKKTKKKKRNVASVETEKRWSRRGVDTQTGEWELCCGVNCWTRGGGRGIKKNKKKKVERVFHRVSGKEKQRTGGARQDLAAVLPQKESRRVLGTICCGGLDE